MNSTIKDKERNEINDDYKSNFNQTGNTNNAFKPNTASNFHIQSNKIDNLFNKTFEMNNQIALNRFKTNSFNGYNNRNYNNLQNNPNIVHMLNYLNEDFSFKEEFEQLRLKGLALEEKMRIRKDLENEYNKLRLEKLQNDIEATKKKNKLAEQRNENIMKRVYNRIYNQYNYNDELNKHKDKLSKAKKEYRHHNEHLVEVYQQELNKKLEEKLDKMLQVKELLHNQLVQNTEFLKIESDYADKMNQISNGLQSQIEVLKKYNSEVEDKRKKLLYGYFDNDNNNKNHSNTDNSKFTNIEKLLIPETSDNKKNEFLSQFDILSLSQIRKEINDIDRKIEVDRSNKAKEDNNVNVSSIINTIKEINRKELENKVQKELEIREEMKNNELKINEKKNEKSTNDEVKGENKKSIEWINSKPNNDANIKANNIVNNNSNNIEGTSKVDNKNKEIIPGASNNVKNNKEDDNNGKKDASVEKAKNVVKFSNNNSNNSNVNTNNNVNNVNASNLTDKKNSSIPKSKSITNNTSNNNNSNTNNTNNNNTMNQKRVLNNNNNNKTPNNKTSNINSNNNTNNRLVNRNSNLKNSSINSNNTSQLNNSINNNSNALHKSQSKKPTLEETIHRIVLDRPDLIKIPQPIKLKVLEQVFKQIDNYCRTMKAGTILYNNRSIISKNKQEAIEVFFKVLESIDEQTNVALSTEMKNDINKVLYVPYLILNTNFSPNIEPESLDDKKYNVSMFDEELTCKDLFVRKLIIKF